MTCANTPKIFNIVHILVCHRYLPNWMVFFYVYIFHQPPVRNPFIHSRCSICFANFHKTLSSQRRSILGRRRRHPRATRNVGHHPALKRDSCQSVGADHQPAIHTSVSISACLPFCPGGPPPFHLFQREAERVAAKFPFQLVDKVWPIIKSPTYADQRVQFN